MGEAHESKNPGLKILARRKADSVSSGTERPMARIISTRLVDPIEYPRLRKERFEETRSALLNGTRVLPLGITRSLDLLPQVQQARNTCMLACAISVAKGIERKKGSLWILDEKVIAKEARERGLLQDAGMATITPNDSLRSLEFLRDRLGLNVQRVFSREGPIMANTLTEGIRNGNCALINSSAHWVTVLGLDKQSDEQISWLAMDPLKPDLQHYSTDDLTNRLLGSLLLSQERLGGVSEKFI